MLDIILILVAIAVIIFIIAAMQPSDFRITRTGTITAPASAVFAQVNDLHKWDACSPWAKLDPDAKNSFEGSESGVGAYYEMGRQQQSRPRKHDHHREPSSRIY